MILIAFVISDQLANVSYLLRDSFVLDSGAIIYIYNNSTRFINLELSNQLLFTRTNIVNIQGFGDINIIILTLNRKKHYFLLKDIIYIQGFHINVISFRKLFKISFR
jgi:hypothetical protein